MQTAHDIDRCRTGAALIGGSGPYVHGLTDRRRYICSPEIIDVGIFAAMALPDGIDTEKLAEVALALLSLTSFTDHGQVRAWKGLDWDLLDLLHERGWIYDPRGKARSVVLTEAGHRLSEQAFTKHFVQTGSVE